jgi:hypothetical protein
MHSCAFVSDHLQIEPEMTERITGPSIKDREGGQRPLPVTGTSARIWRSVTHGSLFIKTPKGWHSGSTV